MNMRIAVSILLVLVFANFVFSGSVLAAAEEPVPGPDVGQQEERSIDYALPYPGILPDNPLYFLKVTRDRIVSWLVLDPVKKGYYLLLLSDKRLAAGKVLVETGKADLGVTTVVNGEEYFSEAIDQVEVAKRKKVGVGEIAAKLMVAGRKHEEVIDALATRVNGQEATRLTKAYESSQKSKSRVMKLLTEVRD